MRLLATGLITVAGVASWLWVTFLTVFFIWVAAEDPNPVIAWLYDWHVYAAGGRQLIDGGLYTSPLTFPGWPIPVDTYNLPPFSAVWAVPLLGVADETGGIIWIAMGALAWTSSWWLVFRLYDVPRAWAWTGIALAAYSIFFYWFGANMLLGNINHLVLVLVVTFAVAFVRRHYYAAGLLLGLAIATKLWPIVLVVPLIRDGRWRAAWIAVASSAAFTIIPVVWLGLDVVLPMVQALRLNVPVEPGVAVLWTSAFRELWDWWPTWAAVAIGLAVLALPVKGLAAIGLAMLAGISFIPNIWDHYLPTLLVAIALAGLGSRFPEVSRAASSRSHMPARADG